MEMCPICMEPIEPHEETVSSSDGNVYHRCCYLREVEKNKESE